MNLKQPFISGHFVKQPRFSAALIIMMYDSLW